LANPAAEQLFETLRAKRRELADAAEVPAFVIFSDASLRSMVELMPQDADEFLDVHGVGATKAARYAAEFLPLLKE
jgi:ATP-dependent DNA helicase RecQ